MQGHVINEKICDSPARVRATSASRITRSSLVFWAGSVASSLSALPVMDVLHKAQQWAGGQATLEWYSGAAVALVLSADGIDVDCEGDHAKGVPCGRANE